MNPSNSITMIECLIINETVGLKQFKFFLRQRDPLCLEKKNSLHEIIINTCVKEMHT